MSAEVITRALRGLSDGGPEGTRTPDPLHAMQVRYQLRHRPIFAPRVSGAT